MLCTWAEANELVAFDSKGDSVYPTGRSFLQTGSLVSNAAWSKLSAKQREGFLPGAPAVAMELCSYSDSPLTPPPSFDLDFEQFLL
jgi:hypothetical protein